MTGFRFLPATALAVLLASKISAQDDDLPTVVALPSLLAYKLSPETYFILHGKVSSLQADFIRRLRRVPAVASVGEPSSLIIETTLKRKSNAFGTKDAYVESDWMKPDELAVAAALVPRTALAVDELFGVPERKMMKSVIAKTKEDYYALIDAWAEDERTKREARSFSGIFVRGYRTGFETTVPGTWTLVMADTVLVHLPESFRAQMALTEGLQTYLTALEVGDYKVFVTTETSPNQRTRGKVEALYQTAREVLARPKHEDLERLFRSDLNSLTLERLSVAFSVIDFLLQKDRSVWKIFVETLDRESREGKKLKGPEGRFQALLSAIQEALGLDLKGLEEELRKFTAGSYLFPEELARVVGLDRECAESTYQGFEAVCRLKREGKPVSEKGERIHAEILRRLEKKLEKEKF